MEWTRTNLALIVFLVPGGTLFVVIAIGCIFGCLSPSCHFTWRWGKCWKINRVCRRARNAYRPNEYSPANAQAIQMQSRRPAPKLPAQGVSGSLQPVEVNVLLESVEVQMPNLPQKNEETRL